MLRFKLRRCVVVLTASLCVAVIAGCSTYRREYPAHSPEQVWTAAMSVAQSPDYEGDWHVAENHVWIEDDWARMEIEREIRRLTHEPYTESMPEKRRWQFRVTMEGGDPVVLTFANRNPSIPGWTVREAQRFFDDVNEMLMAVPAAGVGEDDLPPMPEVKFEQPMDEDDAAMDGADADDADDDSDDTIR